MDNPKIYSVPRVSVWGANMWSQTENYPGNFHRTLHWNKTKAGSWEDGSSEGSEMNSVKNHFLVS